MLIFSIFLWISANFHGGSDLPDPPPFFRWGVRNFFMGGQEVKMEGQIIFDPSSDLPEGRPCPMLLGPNFRRICQLKVHRANGHNQGRTHGGGLPPPMLFTFPYFIQLFAPTPIVYQLLIFL